MQHNRFNEANGGAATLPRPRFRPVAYAALVALAGAALAAGLHGDWFAAGGYGAAALVWSRYMRAAQHAATLAGVAAAAMAYAYAVRDAANGRPTGTP